MKKKDSAKKNNLRKIFTWQNTFRALTVLNTAFLIFAIWLFVGPYHEFKMNELVSKSRLDHHIFSKIDCLRDNFEKKIPAEKSTHCLESEKLQHYSQYELYEKNTHVKEWAELKNHCDELERLNEELNKIYFEQEK